MLRFAIATTVAATFFASGCGCDAFSGGSTDGGGNRAGVGDVCGGQGDCRTGLLCVANTCEPSRMGVRGSVCQLSADCAAGLFCDATRTCATAGDGSEGDRCDGTSDCEAELLCVLEGFSGRCRAGGNGDLGDACVRETDCLAGLSCTTGTDGTPVCLSPPGIPAGDGGIVAPPSLPYWPGESCGSDGDPARAYFDVPGAGTDGDFYRLPFPNDIRRTAEGLDLSGHPSPGTVLPIDIIDRYLRAAEADQDGFATNPVVFFRFSQPYDWDSLAEQFRLVDIDPASPNYGEDVGNVAWLTTSGSLSKYICPNWFALRTAHGHPLAPGRTYAVILLTGIRPAPEVGGTFARDTDFDAMLDDTAPPDAALASAHTAYAPLRAWLSDSGTAASSLLNAAVFTTQTTSTIVSGLRSVIRAQAAPALSDLTVCEAGTTSPCDDGTDARACHARNEAFVEIHGRIALPIFQQGTPPYETPEDGGGIEVDGSGLPTIARTEPVCFALTVPRDVDPPADGFPLMLYAHGTGGSFGGAVQSGLASDVSIGTSRSRAATMAIDLPQHGARRGDSTTDPEHLFFNFLNPRAARDNITQGSADLFALVHWATAYAEDAGASPTGRALRFDSSRITLFAHSQGATHASGIIPFEPDLLAVVLSGNGGDLTQSLLTKTEPIDIASVLPFALLDPDREGHLTGGAFHPALAIFQSYFERVDSVNFGRYLYRAPLEGDHGRHVFQTYGLDDHYSTEATMRAYARSVGMAVVRPTLRDLGLGEFDAPLSANVIVNGERRTVGLRQYMPTGTDDGHFVATRTELGRADVLRFLTGAMAGEVPVIGAAE